MLDSSRESMTPAFLSVIIMLRQINKIVNVKTRSSRQLPVAARKIHTPGLATRRM